MGDAIRLDRVFLFQDQISFLIPHEWEEEDIPDTDHYLYCPPGTDSGWLRVSLITQRGIECPTDELLSHQEDWLDDGTVRVFREEKSGNLIKKWQKTSIENGEPIYLYYWSVANAILPDKLLQAVFSYTILADRRATRENTDTVELLDELICGATFGPPLTIQ